MRTVGNFPGVKHGQSVTLTTHPHLMPRSRMSRSYISSPQSTCMVSNGAALLLHHFTVSITKYSWQYRKSYISSSLVHAYFFCKKIFCPKLYYMLYNIMLLCKNSLYVVKTHYLGLNLKTTDNASKLHLFWPYKHRFQKKSNFKRSP
jgi:hypothetical protein